MAIPNAPQEGLGSKIIFVAYDNAGSNAAAILKGYQQASLNGTPMADLGVYPTSGTPKSGYIATTAGTEIAISASSVPCQGVIVKADPDNTEDIWVGATGITTTKASGDGYRLSPGETVGVPCRNANTVFIRRGGSVNQGAYWIASKD